MTGSDRLPPLPPDQWTAEQRRHAQEIIDGPRGALISPFVPMLRSPELMAHSQRMGEYLRYRSAIGLRLSELAILLVARHWTQQVEWAIHVPIALREGVRPETVTAIAHGQRPASMADDEAIVHEFCTELQERQEVSDATWERGIAAFGEQAVVDLVGVVGYYGYLAMLMNAARTPVPLSSVAPLQSLRRR